MKGPYFPGQKPMPCGHYHPDVLVVRDEKVSPTEYVRTFDCSECGRNYEEIDPAEAHGSSTIGILVNAGLYVFLAEGEIEHTRKMELERMVKEFPKKK